MDTKKFKHKPISFNSNVQTSRHSSSKFESRKEEKVEARPNFISHLQPEILPMELMKTLLITRGGGDDIRNEKCLERIISLFYKHITPKPQRMYKSNRKGKELTRIRKKREGVQFENDQDFKIMESDPVKASKLGLREAKSSDTSLPSLKTESDQSRLKRPIECIDLEQKKVKLSSSSSSSLDRIKIVDRSTLSKTSSDSKTKDEHKSVGSPVKSDSPSVSVIHKKVKLSRDYSSEAKTSSKAERKERESLQRKETEPTQRKEREPTQRKEREPTQRKEREPTQRKETEPLQRKEREPTQRKEREPTQRKEREPLQGKETEPLQRKEREPTQRKEREPTQRKEREPTERKREDDQTPPKKSLGQKRSRSSSSSDESDTKEELRKKSKKKKRKIMKKLKLKKSKKSKKKKSKSKKKKKKESSSSSGSSSSSD